MGNIDLHIHSIHSDDGEYTVERLIRQAEEAGLSVAAIADHDSVNACLERHRLNLETSTRWIDAIEISCRHKDRDYHLLGYFIDPFDLRYTKLEENMRRNEEAATQERLDLLASHFGFAFPMEALRQVAQGKLITGEVICEWLLENEENRKVEELRKYFPGGSRSDNPLVNFYWDYLSQGKVAYVEVAVPSMDESIRLVHETGGIAVLAHPGNNVKEDKTVLDELTSLGLDGIEAFSSYHGELQNAFYVAYAKKKNLLFTCGSDYHGKTKPKIKLGLTHCPCDAQAIVEMMERGRK
jgi:predicted metal-dependent phosphoesterase TrpH